MEWKRMIRPRARVASLVLLLGLCAMLSGCFLFSSCNALPTASFEISDDPRPRVEVSFTNTSTDPDGFDDLREFLWDFGDNSDPADTLNAAHTYPVSGLYTVRLTVTDSQGGTDSHQETIEVRSPVFADPRTEEEYVGEGIVWDEAIQNNRITNRYQYSQALQAWIACYPIFIDPQTGLRYLVPRNICGLLSIDFQPDLDQPIVLRLQWRIVNSLGQSVFWYDYPTDFPIRDPSRITGLVAAWDLWNQGRDMEGRSADGAVLAEGRYETQLTVIEVNTGDLFYWVFPFAVEHGC